MSKPHSQHCAHWPAAITIFNMWHISQDPYLNPQPRNIPSSQESPDSTTPRFINHQDDMLAHTFGLFVDTERTPVFGDPWASAETPGRVEDMMRYLFPLSSFLGIYPRVNNSPIQFPSKRGSCQSPRRQKAGPSRTSASSTSP
jgi:hypothetical protein